MQLRGNCTKRTLKIKWPAAKRYFFAMIQKGADVIRWGNRAGTVCSQVELNGRTVGDYRKDSHPRFAHLTDRKESSDLIMKEVQNAEGKDILNLFPTRVQRKGFLWSESREESLGGYRTQCLCRVQRRQPCSGVQRVKTSAQRSDVKRHFLLGYVLTQGIRKRSSFAA